ncbi:YceI family protein [Desulfofustis glycolicus]|uniref:Polyisoprenoid-binding protein YceI n=1 Tax=Desulfofustis glycolicus DSM 9705 TaxID=1121409 RepID=A0A1M5V541_9BACT|nr:YceI family protein [Desulfofustis glycolicus]MCB2214988.1 YceI family protein [Desulfobulbaceae bacterium]SHH70345.1 Polyisoprenoid-binding protein YceI [Desulfofustis glycolicus DSM 9705]
MKKYKIFTLIAVIVTLGTSSAAIAAARQWEIDKPHANFYFSVDHIYSKVRGHFDEFSGQVHFDPANLAESSFVFDIQVDSITTAVAKRDKHLQSADFFDADSFPLMSFRSTSITDAGNGVYQVNGTFTVKGADHDLNFPLTLAGIKDHPAAEGKEVAGFNGSLTIDRLQYGVGTGKFYDLGIVGKDVEVFISLEVLADK